MDITEALQLWRGSGYRGINGALLQQIDPAAAKRYMGASVPHPEAITPLRNAMKPISVGKVYYRGSSALFKKNCHVETFLSVSVNREDADAFCDDGLVYTITIGKGVRGLQTGIEGETILVDGCFWEYVGGRDNAVTIHGPESGKGYENCSRTNDKVECAKPTVLSYEQVRAARMKQLMEEDEDF